jgi:uncharacterized protein YdcH (DUF465 family)
MSGTITSRKHNGLHDRIYTLRRAKGILREEEVSDLKFISME